MSHDDFAFEPVRGLPEHLPRDEKMLWQGAPRWQSLVTHVFHVRVFAAYFALVIAWRVWAGVDQGVPAGELFLSTLAPLALAAATIGFLALVAWGYEKTTVYTLTNRRIVIRSGVAFQVSFNIPFTAIRNAALSKHRDGTGNISLELDGSAHIAYLHIWPNARPGFVSSVQPMMRNIRQPNEVSKLVAEALVEFNTSAAMALADRDVSTETLNLNYKSPAIRMVEAAE